MQDQNFESLVSQFVPERDLSELSDIVESISGSTIPTSHYVPSTANSEDFIMQEARTILNNEEVVTVLCEENKTLKLECESIETRYKQLLSENAKLHSLLAREKEKMSKYTKKLQFIQDNQEIFARLKQAYLNMKYNESVTRQCVEVKEKSVQTYQGIMCESCLEFADMRNDMLDDSCATIDLRRVQQAQKTLQELKTMIAHKNDHYGLYSIREAQYRKDLADLFEENLSLRLKLHKAVSGMQSEKTQTINKAVSDNKENTVLRKIIAKLEKKLRKIEASFVRISKTKLSIKHISDSSLNEKEKRLVQHITNKYDAKIQEKHLSKVETPFQTPRSTHTNQTPRTPKSPADDEYTTPRTFRSIDESQKFRNLEEGDQPPQSKPNKTMQVLHYCQKMVEYE